MKADKNFRLSPTTKVILALTKFKSAEDRNAFRRAMIDAQLCETQAKLARGKEKEKN